MAGALPAAPRESLPCAAPTPRPPPSPCRSPDPAVALTPERSGAARAGGGILRREHQEKTGPRHVRGEGGIGLPGGAGRVGGEDGLPFPSLHGASARSSWNYCPTRGLDWMASRGPPKPRLLPAEGGPGAPVGKRRALSPPAGPLPDGRAERGAAGRLRAGEEGAPRAARRQPPPARPLPAGRPAAPQQPGPGRRGAGRARAALRCPAGGRAAGAALLRGSLRRGSSRGRGAEHSPGPAALPGPHQPAGADRRTAQLSRAGETRPCPAPPRGQKGSGR